MTQNLEKSKRIPI